MGHRLSKITTRTGGKGTTGLATGLGVEKDSPRVFAMGAVDELNSCIGVVLGHGVPPQVRECLVDVQHRLFEAGAQLSAPGQQRITEQDVLAIERSVERFNADLEPLKEFVLPGGSLAATACHGGLFGGSWTQDPKRRKVSRASTIRMTSTGPSIIMRLRASFHILWMGVSMVSPTPPWICKQWSATRKPSSVQNILAM